MNTFQIKVKGIVKGQTTYINIPTVVNIMDTVNTKFMNRIMDNVYNKYVVASPCVRTENGKLMADPMCVVDVDGVQMLEFEVCLFEGDKDITKLISNYFNQLEYAKV